MRPILAVVAACALTWMSGCTKIAARDLIREGNTLYHDGKYADAIAKYDEASKLEPDGVTLFWNRACAAESIVLKMRDPTRLADRKLYTDMALSDFKTWLDRLESPTEADRTAYLEHRLALLDADERCDDLLSYWLEKHNAEPKEEGWYSVIARQYDKCGRTKDADQWFVKRTVDFPQIGARLPQPRDPQARAALPGARQRPAVQRQLQRGRAHRHRQRGHRRCSTRRRRSTSSSARPSPTARSRSRSVSSRAATATTRQNTAQENLNRILAREDTMAAWRQQKAICDIDSRSRVPARQAARGPLLHAAAAPAHRRGGGRRRRAEEAHRGGDRRPGAGVPEPDKGKGKGKKGGK
jgi:tetratricopeptide (TPR) repeat protein